MYIIFIFSKTNPISFLKGCIFPFPEKSFSGRLLEMTTPLVVLSFHFYFFDSPPTGDFVYEDISSKFSFFSNSVEDKTLYFPVFHSRYSFQCIFPLSKSSQSQEAFSVFAKSDTRGSDNFYFM